MSSTFFDSVRRVIFSQPESKTIFANFIILKKELYKYMKENIFNVKFTRKKNTVDRTREIY